jgi:hypothetical protein
MGKQPEIIDRWWGFIEFSCDTVFWDKLMSTVITEEACQVSPSIALKSFGERMIHYYHIQYQLGFSTTN